MCGYQKLTNQYPWRLREKEESRVNRRKTTLTTKIKEEREVAEEKRPTRKKLQIIFQEITLRRFPPDGNRKNPCFLWLAQ